jgi:uncharacterized membrane protein YphA (DoxX/SURF4 family)
MKYINKSIEWFIGGLFIFSGLIKINDPTGTAIKLEEYFEIFATDFAGFFGVFIPFAMPLSVVLSTLEIVLGVALLAGYRKKWTVIALTLLIVFFTFLTYYSAYFNKVTDCGCFGDAIPLTPWQSFGKDILLLTLLVVLLVQYKSLSDNREKRFAIPVVLSLVFSFSIAGYVLYFLPLIDFLDYKKGNHIPTLMRPQEPCMFEYTLEKDGQTYQFTNYPTDPGYTFVSMKTLNEKACQPKILDYNVQSEEGEDFTDESLTGKKLIIIVQKIKGTRLASFPAIRALVDEVTQAHPDIAPMVFTAEGSRFDAFRHEEQLAVPYYLVDATVLKAMVRSNPGVLALQDGKVVGKWPATRLPDARDLQAAFQ